MVKVIISFIDKVGDQLCLLEEKETEFYYLINLEKMSVSNFGIMDSFYDLVENIDAEENVYVGDLTDFKARLFENEDDLDCDIYAIINHLVEIRRKEKTHEKIFICLVYVSCFSRWPSIS